MFDLIVIPTAVENRELALIFFFANLMECELIKIFEEPGPGQRVMLFGTKVLEAC